MSDAKSGHTASSDDAKDARQAKAEDRTEPAASTGDTVTGHAEEKLVVAREGSAAHTKSGGSPAVDTRGGVVGPNSYFPAGADEGNLNNRVSETDPNYLEAWRKTDEGRKYAGDAARTPMSASEGKTT